ncbi:MAG TPA: hypothetical protein VNX22_03475 [Acidobacteriaceae bacterium]|nr:hypothetical protein [Acidobacteriaceae bacterium]
MPATIPMLQLQSAGPPAGSLTAQGRVGDASSQAGLPDFPTLFLGQSGNLGQSAEKAATTAVEMPGTGFDLSPETHVPVNGSNGKSTIADALNKLNEMKSPGAQLAVEVPVQIAGSPAQVPVESQNSVAASQGVAKAVHASPGKSEKTPKDAQSAGEAVLLSHATDMVVAVVNLPLLSSVVRSNDVVGSGQTTGALPAGAKTIEMGGDTILSSLSSLGHAATPADLTAHSLPMEPPGDAQTHIASQARQPARAPAVDSAVPDGQESLSANFAEALNRPAENETTRGQSQATVSGGAVTEGETSSPRSAPPTMASDMRQSADVGAVNLSNSAAVVNASDAVHSSSFTAAHESAVKESKDGKDPLSAPAVIRAADVHAAPGGVPAAKLGDYSVASVAGAQAGQGPVTAINTGRAATAQDAPSHTNPHMLLDENPLASSASWHISANRLEAGVALHGKEWITVEASRQGGVIKAALSAGASSEHRALETMLSGLSAHLEERQVRVASLAMLAKPGQPSGSMAGTDSNGDGTGAPPNRQPTRETRATQHDNETTRASATEDALDNIPKQDGQVAVTGRHRISYQA